MNATERAEDVNKALKDEGYDELPLHEVSFIIGYIRSKIESGEFNVI